MATLAKLCRFVLLTLALPLQLGAQGSPSFDGRTIEKWLALTIQDTSWVRVFLAASAIRRAPPQFRQQFIQRLVPDLESNSTERSGQAVGVVMTVVNEGQAGGISEQQGIDLKPAVSGLRRIAEDTRHPERRGAWFLLVRADSADRAGLAPLARALFRDDKDQNIRSNAISLLGRVRDTSDIPLLLQATRDRQAGVRESAIGVLSRWQPRRALPELIAALDDSVPDVRGTAILALARVGPGARAAVPRLLRFIEDTTHASTGSFAETLSANAAFALSQIMPRRGRSGIPIRVEVDDAGNAIRSDGLGQYIHRADSVSVLMALSMNLMLEGARSLPVKTVSSLRRSLLIDLSRPVPNGGATSLGLIRDNEAAVHMFYAHVHRKNILSMGTLDPADTLFTSDRTEFQFRIDGAPHLLQMGEWVQGEFQGSNATPIHGEGTSSATISHPNVGSWTFSAPEGSKARLWDLSDPSKPIDRGLYYLPFRFRWYLLDPP